MKGTIDKDTLFDFFDGNTTSIQRKLIEEWLRQPGSSDQYYQYLDEWESQRIQFLPNEKEALQKYQIVMLGEQEKELIIPVERGYKWKRLFLSGLLRFGSIAACLIVLALWFWHDQILYQRYDSSYGITNQYTLSDGTRVMLNANSQLWVPRFGFNKERRVVKLEGEAEFEVTHKSNVSRFVVEMDDGYAVEVLGTKFVVLSREKSKRVFLTEGKIKMVLPEGRQIYMKPGHLFEVNDTDRAVLTTPEKPQQYLAWKSQQFYFDNTPLSEVARQMEERFGVVVEITDPVLEEKQLGGVYEAQTPDDLLLVLTELYHLEISQNKNRIELRPGSNP